MTDIEQIIIDEKYNLELKQEVNFKEPKSYLKTVSSFANGNDIGYIIFGVEDGTKKIVGINNVKKSYEEIANRIKTRIEPSIVPMIDILEIDNKNIIVVKVIPGNNTPYYYVNRGTKTAYIRKGDQDTETNHFELNELILKGQNKSWDILLTDKYYKDFTFNTLKKYFQKEKKIVIEKEDLISFGLLVGNELTNTAILFSDQNPNISSFISCTRWNGNDKINAIDDEEFHGCILDQLEKAMIFIRQHISIGWTRDGSLAHKELAEYDLPSVREAIINALAHRNYLQYGTHVEIDIYDDQIDVVSCGDIDCMFTLEEIINKSISRRRNPLICDIFSRLGYMERRGSGIKKIMAAYCDDDKKPEFQVYGQDLFVTTFYKRSFDHIFNDDIDKETDENHPQIIRKSSANHPQNIRKSSANELKHPETIMKIIEYLQKNKTINKKEIMGLGISEGTIKYALKTLKDKGIISSHGKNKNTYYILNEDEMKIIRKSSANHPQIIRKSSVNESKIIEYLQKNKKINKKEIMDLGISEGAIKYTLKTLKDKGIISSHGTGKSTYYILNKDDLN